MPSDTKTAEEILQTLVKGRAPHSHDRPGFWDGFDADAAYWQSAVVNGECGPKGECFVCTAILQARALLQNPAPAPVKA